AEAWLPQLTQAIARLPDVLSTTAASSDERMPAPAAVARVNLPAPTTPLIGREAEVRDVAGLLRALRLVTLTGPGGSGKTRLAIAVAEELGATTGQGVEFVSLAPIVDAQLVPSSIAQALGVHESGEQGA